MPNKFVFPGGAVDAEDNVIPLAKPLVQSCHARLLEDNSGPSPETLAVAAIRELWEETGLILGAPEAWRDAPEDWSGFAQEGFRPSAEGMYFFFRAITPPGPPRRFDARFFLVDADQLTGDLDDFSGASDELSHLQWVPLDEARTLNLPSLRQSCWENWPRCAKSVHPPQCRFSKTKMKKACFCVSTAQSSSISSTIDADSKTMPTASLRRIFSPKTKTDMAKDAKISTWPSALT